MQSNLWIFYVYKIYDEIYGEDDEIYDMPFIYVKIFYLLKTIIVFLNVICTDKTRKTFKYLRQDGKIVTDIEAENIIKSFKASSTVHIEKSLDQLKKEYESDDLYESEEERLEAYYNTAKEAREFGGPFLNQLIKRTYKKTEDGTLIAIPPTNIIKDTDSYIDGIPKSQYEEWEKYIN